MLALKKFISLLSCRTLHKDPSALLAVWIESNILLQLASAPFDKQDETLLPAAGACVNCPKRTGFNKLLFGDVARKDSCSDPNCFCAKIDASVSRTLEAKPQIVQISSAWNSREGAPLGRNRYVVLDVKKLKANGNAAKQSPFQRPCTKMQEAIVMDGGERGQVVKVCVDPACRVHHPNTPSRCKSNGSRRRNGDGLKKRNWSSPLAIGYWPRSCSSGFPHHSRRLIY